MTSFLILCPSRGRPENILELIRSWEVTGAHAELLVIVDNDDPSLNDYLQLQPQARIQVNNVARRVGPILNAFAVPAAAKYDVIGFLGDDHRPRTPGWDEALARALAEKPGVAFGNDLVQGGELPTAAAISAPLIAELGYMCPPGVKHLYVDNFWRKLGEGVDCLQYLPDVIVEHLHPNAGTAQWDASYRKNNAPQEYHAGKAAFDHFLRRQWPRDLARLRKHLELPEQGTLTRLRERLEVVEPEPIKHVRRRLGLRRRSFSAH